MTRKAFSKSKSIIGFIQALVGLILIVAFAILFNALFAFRNLQSSQTTKQPKFPSSRELSSARPTSLPKDRSTDAESAIENPITITLENTTWVLKSYGEQNNLQNVLEDTEITAIFYKDKSKISGSAGCNRYFASFGLNGNKLSISAPGSTKMYCSKPKGVMTQERQYLTALEAVESFRMRDGQLRMFYSGDHVLTFIATK